MLGCQFALNPHIVAEPQYHLGLLTLGRTRSHGPHLTKALQALISFLSPPPFSRALGHGSSQSLLDLLVLIIISRRTKDVERLFMGASVIGRSLLEERLFKTSAHCLIGL